LRWCWPTRRAIPPSAPKPGAASEIYIAEQLDVVDPDAIHAVRNAAAPRSGASLKSELLATYRAQAVPGPYSPDAQAAGKRALRNLCSLSDGARRRRGTPLALGSSSAPTT